MLKGCIQLGAAPLLPGAMLDFSPVDTVADVIVSCTLRARHAAYHVLNPYMVPWREVIAAIQSFGYPMKWLPYAEWAALLREHQTGNALQPLQPLLSEEGLSAVCHFDARNTEADSGVAWPRDIQTLMHTYLRYFVRVRFIPSPPNEAAAAAAADAPAA